MPKPGKTRGLTRKEELILLTVYNLGSDAYLVAIVDHLARITGKDVSLTSVYLPLDRLRSLGLIASEFGEATAMRGGRRKKIYRITTQGFEALEEYKRISDLLWKKFCGTASSRD
jgi:DNA-binding PadR family transcriptional regulator